MPDDVRPGLIAYLPRIIGIPEDDHDFLRNEIFAQHALHVFAPAALRQVGHEEHARRLQDEVHFLRAKQAAREIVEELGDTGPDMTPIQWAVYRTGEAAGLADWFSSMRDDELKGALPMTPYGACAAAAAGTAYQAWRVGCEDIWDLALVALRVSVIRGHRFR